MNIKPCLKYQVKEHMKAIGIYWMVAVIGTLVLAAMFGLFLNEGVSDTENISVNGFDFSICIVLLVMGLVTFYSNFGMMLQFGATRKALFLSRVLTTLIICAIVVLLNRIFQFALTFVLLKALRIPDTVMFGNILDASFREMYYQGMESTPVIFMQSLLWEYGIYLMIMAISNFCSVLFYRLNVAGRIAVGAGAPVLFLIVLPAIDIKFLGGRITDAAIKAFLQAFGFMPVNAAASITAFIVTFALFSACSWLLMRRLSLKKK